METPRCDRCFKRKGGLVFQVVFPAQPGLDILKPWVFRYYLCRWCRGTFTRDIKRFCSHFKVPPGKCTVIPHRPDEELLKEEEMKTNDES